MKRLFSCFLALALAVCVTPAPLVAEATVASDPSAGLQAATAAGVGVAAQDAAESGFSERPDLSLSDDFTMRSIGIGGHGAVFDAVISPFDSNTMLADCDMGALYVTHDAGLNWEIKSCGGRVWDIKADPTTAGTFYAAGSGLWRSTDNGDTWNLLWPNPATITHTPTKLNHTRTYYFSTDSYPDSFALGAICVDDQDGDHLVALASAAANYSDSATNDKQWHYVFESLDGGASFAPIAQFKMLKGFKYNNWVNSRLFIEHGSSSAESRIVVAVPDGIYEVNREKGALDAKDALVALYEAPVTIEDVQQVVDDQGTHYVVLENVDESTALENKSRVKLWHTSDFSDSQAAVDMTGELVGSLPRHYSGKKDGAADSDCEILTHNVVAISAPSLDRMYLSYRAKNEKVNGNMETCYAGDDPTWQGVCGLVTYDASRASGSTFQWAYGVRLMWNGDDKDARLTPDQNRIMARAHCDSSFALFNIAVDPRNPRAIAFGTHTGLMYSPDIDKDVGTYAKIYDNVNIYPRYSSYVRANEKAPENYVHEAFMRSTGLEVTVAERVSIDPFDADHLLIGLDDAGLIQSFDGGVTWTNRRSVMPENAADTCFDTVFDEGRCDVVYGLWDARGGSPHLPAKEFLTSRARFAISYDGGDTWECDSLGQGLPSTATGIRMAVVYPRDETGAITDGERTIYLATMGFGFYVSHDSGRSFQPMNAAFPLSHAIRAVMRLPPRRGARPSMPCGRATSW